MQAGRRIGGSCFPRRGNSNPFLRPLFGPVMGIDCPEWPVTSSPGRPRRSSRPGLTDHVGRSARPGRLSRLIGTACWANSFRWVCPSPARPFMTRSNLLPSLCRQSPENYNLKTAQLKNGNFRRRVQSRFAFSTAGPGYANNCFVGPETD